MTAPIRVVMVDDQQLVRVGFQRILETEPGIEVVGEAGDGARGDRGHPLATTGHRPDGHPDAGHGRARGDAPDRSSRRRAAPRVIILTTFELDEYVFEALRAGASGFLIKNTPPEELVEAIRSVVAGGGLLSPGVTAKVIGRVRSPPGGRP